MSCDISGLCVNGTSVAGAELHHRKSLPLSTRGVANQARAASVKIERIDEYAVKMGESRSGFLVRAAQEAIRKTG